VFLCSLGSDLTLSSDAQSFKLKYHNETTEDWVEISIPEQKKYLGIVKGQPGLGDNAKTSQWGMWVQNCNFPFPRLALCLSLMFALRAVQLYHE
jgi:hypothetical protein